MVNTLKIYENDRSKMVPYNNKKSVPMLWLIKYYYIFNVLDNFLNIYVIIINKSSLNKMDHFLLLFGPNNDEMWSI